MSTVNLPFVLVQLKIERMPLAAAADLDELRSYLQCSSQNHSSKSVDKLDEKIAGQIDGTNRPMVFGMPVYAKGGEIFIGENEVTREKFIPLLTAIMQQKEDTNQAKCL